MNEWLHALQRCGERGMEAVLVTVASGKGSVPRDAGVKMVVTIDALHGTIGGGELEFQATGIARDLLRARGDSQTKRFPLGASLGQNCGGAANLVFERVAPGAQWVAQLAAWHAAGTPCMAVTPVGAGVDARLLVSARDIWGTLGDAARDAKATAQARALLSQPSLDSQLVVLDDTSEPTSVLIDPVRPSDFRVFIFGAGHVGRALARVLGTVSCEVEWIDSRANEFPREVPENVRVMVTERPADRVASAPRGAYYVVLTHSHALDFAILQRVLERGDFAYCGMIGSPTKRRTFENGLAKHGTARAALERLTCPIGIPGLHGKEPGTIAVAVAAQLIGLHEQARAAGPIA